jgi:hypothetical protein
MAVVDDSVRNEDRDIRRLRRIVDFSLQYIAKEALTHDQAMDLVAWVRRFALDLFPGKEEAFDIIYAPRFRRVLNERFRRA